MIIAEMVNVTQDTFGVFHSLIDGKKYVIQRFTITNKSGTQIQVINYGATITKLIVKDGFNCFRDVVLGFDNIEGYLGKSGGNPYIGATIGRVCNRIQHGTFILNNQEFHLSTNDGKNQLHGGNYGFDKKVWDWKIDDDKVVLKYLSKDGEEGYPGDLLVEVTFELTEENSVRIGYRASTNKSTPISLTNHTYFNLSGHEAGKNELRDHWITINANNYTPLNSENIPTGTIESVIGTFFDFREAVDLHAKLQKP